MISILANGNHDLIGRYIAQSFVMSICYSDDVQGLTRDQTQILRW